MFIRHTDDAEEVDEDASSTTRVPAAPSCSRRSSSPTRSAPALPDAAGTSTRAQASDGDAFGADPGEQRALPAREAAAAAALLHLRRASARRDRHAAVALWAEYERVAEETRTSRCAGCSSARADLSRVPRAVPGRSPHDVTRPSCGAHGSSPAPTGTSSCSSTTRRSPRSRPSSASTPTPTRSR